MSGHWSIENGGGAVWIEDYTPPKGEQPPRYPTRGTLGKDGLLAHVMHDQSGRPITEFELPPGRSKADTWMAPYRLPPQLAIGAAFEKNPSEAKAARRLEEHYASLKR